MKFELKQTVTISASGETGDVIGRAEYAHAENSYLVRYKCADGRAVESWWTEGALE
jgi:N-acetylmuramic acid 6-phosphate (MurNAc-6-P) etherase